MNTEPRLHRTTFIFDFMDVTGPPFRPSYARVDMLSASTEVTVRVRDGGTPYVNHVKVYGHRAKKDGTASVLPAEAEFFFTYSGDTPPDHIMETVREAERLTADMLRGSGEVSV